MQCAAGSCQVSKTTIDPAVWEYLSAELARGEEEMAKRVSPWFEIGFATEKGGFAHALKECLVLNFSFFSEEMEEQYESISVVVQEMEAVDYLAVKAVRRRESLC